MKGSFAAKNKITTNGKLDQQKGIKSTAYGKYVTKSKIIFFPLKFFFFFIA